MSFWTRWFSNESDLSQMEEDMRDVSSSLPSPPPPTITLMEDYVRPQVHSYKEVFLKLWTRTKEMKDLLDLQQNRLHKKNTVIQLSVVYLSAASAFFQAFFSSRFEFVFDTTINNSTIQEDTYEETTVTEALPIITLVISTYSSIIIATARHLKIEERIGRICNLKERFAELLSKTKYYLVYIRPWENPDYYKHDTTDTRKQEWDILTKSLDKEYHNLLDIRRELYINYYKTVYVSSYHKYMKMANRISETNP